MKKGQKLWTREELILAINLYWKLEFGKMHKGNPDIIKLASLINRTPSAVGRKLGNFGSFDLSLHERGIGGLPHTSKLDKIIWNEFFENFEELSFESEKLRAGFENKSIEELNDIDLLELPIDGLVRDQLVKARVNQNFFRKAILASYKSTCCITGINHPSLLVAGHIIPWSVDEKNRMNSRNGLCLNSLHDKAFDLGLIGIDPDYRVVVSPKILETMNLETFKTYFQRHENQKITLPNRYLPDQALLEYHYQNRFNH
jgi:putative restriction endonuclease